MGKTKWQEKIEERQKEVSEKKSKQCSTARENRYEITEEDRIRSMKRDVTQKFKIPKRFQGKTFENYDKEKGNEKAFNIVKEYVDEFSENRENGTWLILSGGYGLGKTHLALAAGREVIDYFAKRLAQGNRNLAYGGRSKIKFISSSEMIQSIRDSYDSDQLDENQLMTDYKRTELLIIDDLGTEKASDWQREKMYIILNYRYNELLPTIITTNLNGSELTEHISPRVVERMIEAAGQGKYMLNFKGKSYRRLKNG